MRALVTGAAGFIGSNLVDRLLADGHWVVGLDNLSTGVEANLARAERINEFYPGQFRLVRGDITAPELTGIVAGNNPDIIFHLAAQVDVRTSVSNPQFDAAKNILGTINLCEAARLAGVRRIVYAASGGSRYGAPAYLPVGEEVLPAPLSPYGVSKLAGEMYLGAYAWMYGMAPICLALANVYGPRQNPYGEAGVITIFGKAMINGGPTIIYGDGTAARDYVFVGDVVDAFAQAGQAPADVTGTFNIGTGQQTTVAEIHRVVSELLGRTSQPRHSAARTGEVRAIALHAAKAESELGWKPGVDLVDGVRQTIQWLRAVLDPQPGPPAQLPAADSEQIGV
ncbi:NAD-dependent epimerase/dehydratase family protein [Mycolicibacterium komossense]|uniref:GDP-mannose 4,6-dehydratase n=1 Tax=Mycolicibacterium komossense TaxID=1779 RepID=A0ABT3CJH6_9MYCO|nr:NAD-dependent epimerase/dehydratase family protein [Mycolicibacterium komossense]MCV7229643.1 GDP-mannose 4,6-dehydratase [Mycolicibacterium komossense]